MKSIVDKYEDPYEDDEENMCDQCAAPEVYEDNAVLANILKPMFDQDVASGQDYVKIGAVMDRATFEKVKAIFDAYSDFDAE